MYHMVKKILSWELRNLHIANYESQNKALTFPWSPGTNIYSYESNQTKVTEHSTLLWASILWKNKIFRHTENLLCLQFRSTWIELRDCTTVRLSFQIWQHIGKQEKRNQNHKRTEKTKSKTNEEVEKQQQ